MEKRLPLFLFLSLLILFGWNVCHPREPLPQEPARSTSADTQPDSTSEPAREVAAFEAQLGADEERIETLMLGVDGEPGLWFMEVSNRGASVLSMRVGNYYTSLEVSEAGKFDPQNWASLLEEVATPEGDSGSLLLRTRRSSADLAPADLDQVLWTMEILTDSSGAQSGVEWRYGPGRGVVFTKRLTRVPGTWRLIFELVLENDGSAQAGPVELLLLPAGHVPPALEDRFYQEPRAVAVGGDVERKEYGAEWEGAASSRDESDTLDVPSPLLVAGVHNKYFAFLLRGEDEAGQTSLVGASYRGVKDLTWLENNPGQDKGAWRLIACDLVLGLRVPAPGERHSYTYTIYAGPKEPELLAKEHPAFGPLARTDLSGWAIFSSIGSFLLVILRFFHRLVGNWGVSIILLTICVRGVLFPLNRRSQTSMARYQTKMKRVQPRIDEVKKRFESNPQKLREEQGKIMQEEGAFPPLGGCMPIFLQIPIFFGLFAALRTAFELRQAPFCLWIDDLSRPDRLLEINLPLPLLGEIQYFNLLPILMVVLWVVQQMGMPKPTDEQAARMQKMMMFMPVVMGVFLYNYAAGLSLYMITQSGLGIIEQRVIKKLWPIDDAEVAKKAGKGCGPFSGMMERMAEKHKDEMKRLEQRKSGRPAGDAAKRAEKKKRRRL